MDSEFKNIIARLERQGHAIEKALAALRELEGQDRLVTAVTASIKPQKASRRRGTLTEEGRKRISEALRARWAAKRAAASNGKKRGARKGA